HGAVHHGFHHLGGGDDQLVVGAGVQNDALLDARQAGVADFDAQVSARNHDAVAGVDEIVQGLVVRHRLGSLDLGNDPRLAARFAHQLAGLVDVAAVAGKGHRHVVHADLGHDLDIGVVFIGKAVGGDASAAPVDALVV